jgi:hypothetical protein
VAITSGPNQGGFAVYLGDPDGYTIELFQPPAEAPSALVGGGTAGGGVVHESVRQS